MHALVATPKFLLLVDLDGGGVEVVENHRPEYYGISWFPGTSELVLSHSGLNNADILDFAAYGTSEVGYLTKGDQHTDTFLSMPHQLLCAFDQKVIVTNTGRNRVQLIDFNIAGEYREIGLSSVRWDRLGPLGPYGDHLNSVFLKDGKLYVIAHGFRAGSQLAVFAYPEWKLLSVEKVPDVTGIHNVFVEDDGLILGCHSEAGGLTDLLTGRILWSSGSRVYTRGFAVSESVYFIGESEILSREDRTSGSAGIWVINRSTLKTENYLALGAYGAVHEIRLLDVPDFSHHGVPLVGGVESVKRRLSSDVRAKRLQSALIAEAESEYWARLNPMLGFTSSLGDGWRQAHEALILLISREPIFKMEIYYRLDNSNGLPSHLSIVSGYEGGGDDVRMDAFLIQLMDSDASLTAWRHAGDDWIMLPVAQIKGLPIEGTLLVLQEGNCAVVSVDGSVIGTFELQRSAPSKMGIRAMNASFRAPKN